MRGELEGHGRHSFNKHAPWYSLIGLSVFFRLFAYSAFLSYILYYFIHGFATTLSYYPSVVQVGRVKCLRVHVLSDV